MAEFRRPSRFALALVAVILPALVGLTCRGLIAYDHHRDASCSPSAAAGVSVELPAAPSTKAWRPDAARAHESAAPGVTG